MAVPKRRREDPCTQLAPAADERTLPADLLLEIVARSDICALVRCAAVCKLLRCDILGPSFIHRITQQEGVVPSCILAYLNTCDEEDDLPPHLSLVHPATPASLSFLDDHMSPYMSLFADDHLGDYYPVTSRGGLVLLRRRHVRCKLFELCVYDPITGHHTFLSKPPGISPKQTRWLDRCVLLTVTDGIGCSLVFVPYLSIMPSSSNTSTVKVQTAASTCGTWEPDAMSHTNSGFFWKHWPAIRHNAVVLQGGAIHRLARRQVISYNVYTTEQGTINLPDTFIDFKARLHLGSYYSHDGHKLLRLLAAYEFKISVWDQLSGRDWASQPVMIDMEEKLQSLDPDIPPGRSIRIE